VKYFFLSDGWMTGRVWELGGEWDELGRRRRPLIEKLTISIQENNETLWLFQVEEAVLMLEVMPKTSVHPPASSTAHLAVGQVVLKRLLTADQAIERLCQHQATRAAAETPSATEDDPEAHLKALSDVRQIKMGQIETGQIDARQQSAQSSEPPNAPYAESARHVLNDLNDSASPSLQIETADGTLNRRERTVVT